MTRPRTSRSAAHGGRASLREEADDRAGCRRAGAAEKRTERFSYVKQSMGFGALATIGWSLWPAWAGTARWR